LTIRDTHTRTCTQFQHDFGYFVSKYMYGCAPPTPKDLYFQSHMSWYFVCTMH